MCECIHGTVYLSLHIFNVREDREELWLSIRTERKLTDDSAGETKMTEVSSSRPKVQVKSNIRGNDECHCTIVQQIIGRKRPIRCGPLREQSKLVLQPVYPVMQAMRFRVCAHRGGPGGSSGGEEVVVRAQVVCTERQIQRDAQVQ